jgi:hypothetical protein
LEGEGEVFSLGGRWIVVRWLREGVKVFDRFLVRRKMQARGDGKVGKGKLGRERR